MVMSINNVYIEKKQKGAVLYGLILASSYSTDKNVLVWAAHFWGYHQDFSFNRMKPDKRNSLLTFCNMWVRDFTTTNQCRKYERVKYITEEHRIDTHQ